MCATRHTHLVLFECIVAVTLSQQHILRNFPKCNLLSHPVPPSSLQIVSSKYVIKQFSLRSSVRERTVYTLNLPLSGIQRR
jgi:hypothetical protein